MNLSIRQIIFLFFILFPFLGLTQNSAINSLENLLRVHSKKDTARVNLMNALAEKYLEFDISKTEELLIESEQISKPLEYKKGNAKSLFIRGLSAMKQNQFPQAIEHFNAALNLYQKQKLNTQIAECYTELGHCASNMNEFQRAITYFDKAIALLRKIDKNDLLAINLKNAGYAYFDLSEYDKARIYFDEALALNLKYSFLKEASSCYSIIGAIYLKKASYPYAMEFFNKALKTSEKIKDSIGISVVSNNIALIYRNYEKYDLAIAYYEKSLSIQRRIGDKRNIAIGVNNIGIIYKEKKELNKALACYDEALTLNRELNDKKSITVNLSNIGNVHLDLRQYGEAEKYFKEANKISKEIKYPVGISNSYIGLANSLLFQKRYDESLGCALKAKKIADELKILNYRKDVNNLLAEIYEARGNIKKAFIHYKEYKILSDSLFNKENTNKIAQIEAEYKYGKALDSASIKELELTKKVNTTSQVLEKTKRNYLYAIIGVLLISIISIFVFFYQKLRNAKAETNNIILEQKLLRSQMTPHFIFNALSVLQGMILKKDENKANQYLSKFSRLLRVTLESSREKFTTLSSELAALDNYVALQNIESSRPLEYIVRLDEHVNPEHVMIPPMLIQPFIENAIEHAFTLESKNRCIELSIKLESNKLVCLIQDNGIGLNEKDTQSSSKKKSLSTSITKERIQFLSKELKTDGSVEIVDRKNLGEQGTMVILVIPIKTVNS